MGIRGSRVVCIEAICVLGRQGVQKLFVSRLYVLEKVGASRVVCIKAISLGEAGASRVVVSRPCIGEGRASRVTKAICPGENI